MNEEAWNDEEIFEPYEEIHLQYGEEVVAEVFGDDMQIPKVNPFSHFGIGALELLTEALFMFIEHGHRMGYSQKEVERISKLPKNEMVENMKLLKPSMNGPLLTTVDREAVHMLDGYVIDAMGDAEARAIAKDTIPDIENFLKNQ